MIDEPGWYSYPVVDDDSFEVNVIAEVDADPDETSIQVELRLRERTRADVFVPFASSITMPVAKAEAVGVGLQAGSERAAALIDADGWDPSPAQATDPQTAIGQCITQLHDLGFPIFAQGLRALAAQGRVDMYHDQQKYLDELLTEARRINAALLRAGDDHFNDQGPEQL